MQLFRKDFSKYFFYEQRAKGISELGQRNLKEFVGKHQ
jgi:hypothetical protein